MKTHKSYPWKLLSLSLGMFLFLVAAGSARAAAYVWSAATPGLNNWNVNANWTPATGNPGAADTAFFQDLGASSDQFTANNVVSVSTAISSLQYTNLVNTSWNVTQIPGGTTLTVSGPVVVGGWANGGTSQAAMIGTGAFVVTGTTNYLTLGNTISSGSATPGILDLSGLSTFIFSATNGFVGLGNTPTGSPASRGTGTLTLAAGSNYITTGTIDMNGATGTSSKPVLNLGADTNIINVNTFNVGGGRSTTVLQFGSYTGGLRLRGTGGTDADRTTMVVGNRNTGGTGTFVTSGTVTMDGHPVNMKFATLTLGLMGRSQSGTDSGKYTPSGIFSFDQGIVDATTINMGVVTGVSTNAWANGSLTVGAQATLVASNISLANMNISPTNNSGANGTLALSYGAIANITGSIYKTTSINSTGTVTIAGGTFSVAGSIGSPTNAIDVFSISDAILTLRAGLQAPTTVAAMDTGGNTNVINISAMPPIFAYPAQFPVIQYSNTLGGLGFANVGLGTLPVVSPAYAGYLSNNTANSSIDLVILSGPAPSRALTWDGTPTGDWDTTTTDWRFSGSSTFYRQNDSVLFDDTASGTTTVNLTTTMLPLTFTVSNATKNYTFNGPGGLSGTPAFTKQGAGTLTIANSGLNDFAGGVALNGGKLQLGGADDRLPTNAVVVISNDASAVLDLNNINQTLSAVSGGGAAGGNVTLGSGTLSISGSSTFAGVISGTGALVKSGTGTLTLVGANTYSGGTLINTGTVTVVNSTGSGTGPGLVVIGGGTLQIGTNSAAGSIATQASGFLTNNGALTYNRSDTLTPSDVITGSGSVRHSGSGVLLFTQDNSYTNTTTVDRNNGVLRISSPNALGTLDGGTTVSGGNGSPVSNGGQLEMSGGVTFAPEHLTLGCRGTSVLAWVGPSQFVNHDGTNTWTGPIDITTGGSYIALQSDAGLMRIAGSLSGGPTATSTRMAVLRGVAFGEVSGVISNGPVTTALSLTVGDSGTWTLSGANLYTGATLVTNTATLLVNGSIVGSAVTVVGGTLGGSGTISPPVTIQSAGTLAPGTSAVGTLAVNDSLTNFGNYLFKINKAVATNDYVVVTGTLTNAGTGTVTMRNIGPGLMAGERYVLFSQPLLNGAGLMVASSDGVVWANNLAVDGSVSVVSAPVSIPTTPTNIVFTVSSGSLQVQWPADYTGWRLLEQTNKLATGVSTNILDWGTVAGSTATNRMFITIGAGKPGSFYRLVYP